MWTVLRPHILFKSTLRNFQLMCLCICGWYAPRNIAPQLFSFYPLNVHETKYVQSGVSGNMVVVKTKQLANLFIKHIRACLPKGPCLINLCSELQHFDCSFGRDLACLTSTDLMLKQKYLFLWILLAFKFICVCIKLLQATLTLNVWTFLFLLPVWY